MAPMKIALDAMGGDTAPNSTIAGAMRAAKELPVEIILVGQEDKLKQVLDSYSKVPDNIFVHPAGEVIGMEESPSTAVRKKRDSSINVCVDLVKQGEAAAFVSAGNTGAVVAASTLKLRLLPGIERPGIAVVLPGLKTDTLLIDVGANVHAKAVHLMQYAVMGESYARCVLGIERPTVGLLNVGEEESKGNELSRDAYALLGASGVNFVGNAEGHDIFAGDIDVIVCEGFAGNVALKTAESLAYAINRLLKRAFTKSWVTRFGAFLARDAFRQLRREIDYAERGGAPLLGVDGVAIIGHGGSTPKAIKNALHVAYQAVHSDLNKTLVESIRTVNEHIPT